MTEILAALRAASERRRGRDRRKLAIGLVVAIAVLVVFVVAVPQLRERASTVLAPAKRELTKTFSAGTEQGKLYRWRAADGVVHIESNPPADDSAYEVITYEVERPGTVSSAASQKKVTSETRDGRESFPIGSPFDVYSPDGIERLLNRVDETARQLDERRRVLEDLERQL